MGKSGKTDQEVNIQVPADATVKNAASFKDLLLGALEKGSRITLDLSHVGELDMAFFQVVCAAHRSALERGAEFSVDQTGASETLRDVVALSGFSRHAGCTGDDGSTCPWLEED